jgi:hypothetical protein
MSNHPIKTEILDDQKIPLAECRRLVPDPTITDEELLEIRDDLYTFCNSVFDELAIFPREEQNQDPVEA